MVEVPVLPRVDAVDEEAEDRAADVAGQHLADQVVDRSAGDRGLEPIGVADDPRGEIAAVRAAGDAHPIAVDEAVLDQRVEAGHDVAHRPVAPVLDVRVQEVEAVALRSARVAGVDADPVGGQLLPLPHQRPAVERGRAAVDLEHDRRGVALRVRRGGDEPALDATAVDLVPALDRRDELDVRPGAHEVADLSQLDPIGAAQPSGGNVTDRRPPARWSRSCGPRPRGRRRAAAPTSVGRAR